jgi:hypothetical protein
VKERREGSDPAPDSSAAFSTRSSVVRPLASIVVTDRDGRLIGVLYRRDAEAALGSSTP